MTMKAELTASSSSGTLPTGRTPIDPALATGGGGGVSARRRPHKNILRPDGTQKKQEYRGYIPMEDSLLEN